MPRHKLTPDDRRGQSKGAETKRARREEAELESREKLADAADEAVAVLVAELKAETGPDRRSAALAILAYAWGKPRQAVDMRIERDPDEILAASREKVAELLERRHAAANGDS